MYTLYIIYHISSKLSMLKAFPLSCGWNTWSVFWFLLISIMGIKKFSNSVMSICSSLLTSHLSKAKSFCLDKYHRLQRYDMNLWNMRSHAYHIQHIVLITSTFSMLLWYLLNIVRFFEFGFSYNRVIIQVCCTFSILYENETKESQITFGQTHLFLKVVLTDFGEILWNLLAVSSILMEVSKIWYRQYVK